MKSTRRRLAPSVRQALKEARLKGRASAINATLEPIARKRAKFNQVKAVYKGEKYDSLGEAEYAAKLDLMQSSGQISHWERPKPVVLLEGRTARDRVTYKPDFRVYPVSANAKPYMVDYKGSHVTMTAAWRIKVKLWRAKCPDIELRVAFPDGSEQIVSPGS